MHENLSIRGGVKKRRAAIAAGLLCTLAAAGCGNTINANKASIQPCGSKAYDRKTGAEAVPSVPKLLATASQDVLALQKRVLVDNGRIKLDSPSYPRVITASSTKLTLEFTRVPFLGGQKTDEVIFDVQNGTTDISPGAVICSAGSEFYPNGTFQSLQKYVVETAGLQELSN